MPFSTQRSNHTPKTQNLFEYRFSDPGSGGGHEPLKPQKCNPAEHFQKNGKNHLSEKFIRFIIYITNLLNYNFCNIMVRYNKAEEKEIVRFMRYRNIDLTNIEQTFMTVSDIAKFINRSTMYVQSLC